MSLLTDEGLPDPSNMNFLAQMTLGQIEQWWAQTQELLAALGDDGDNGAGGTMAGFAVAGPAGAAVGAGAGGLAGGTVGVMGGLGGWSGADAERHRQLVHADLQRTRQHSDTLHTVAELVLWLIDTLQVIMTILLVIQIIEILIAVYSTVAALATMGGSLAAVPVLIAQKLTLEAVVQGIKMAARQLIKMAIGAALGALAGAIVAAITVNEQHLSGGDAAKVFAMDMGFGALSGSMALLSPGMAALGLGAGAANIWAQQEVTGKPMSLQDMFNTMNADIALPEGVASMGSAAEGLQKFSAAKSLEATDGMGTAVRLRRGESFLDRWAPIKQETESTCIAANIRRTFRGLGADVPESRIAELGGWDGHGMLLSKQPRAVAQLFCENPDALARLAGGETDIVRAARAGDVGAVSRAFTAGGGHTLAAIRTSIERTGAPVTVAMDVPFQGAHALQVDGFSAKGDWVLVANPSKGVPYRIRTVDFLDHWRGGQAMLPDLGALGVAGAAGDIQRVTPLARLYQQLRGHDEALFQARLQEVDELPLAGASDKVNPDALGNPAPYKAVIPSEVQDAADRAAKLQQGIDKRNNTVADATMRSGRSPFLADDGAVRGSTDPITNNGSIHAEHRTIYLDNPEDQRAVLQTWLQRHPGDAQVDLVTENLPCASLCTPKILNGDWTTDLQAAAGIRSDVDFRVWHHGMGTRGADGRIAGDLTLYSYELPPIRDANDVLVQRRLYISDEMKKKMGYDPATQTILPPPPRVVRDGTTARTYWTPDSAVAFDPDSHYVIPPANVQIVSKTDLESYLKAQIESDLRQRLQTFPQPEREAALQRLFQTNQDLLPILQNLMDPQEYNTFVGGLLGV